jgi:hypothetical protein
MSNPKPDQFGTHHPDTEGTEKKREKTKAEKPREETMTTILSNRASRSFPIHPPLFSVRSVSPWWILRHAAAPGGLAAVLEGLPLLPRVEDLAGRAPLNSPTMPSSAM